MTGGVITFHGSDHKCGVSQTAQGIAEMISELAPSRRILLLHSEGSPGCYYSMGAGLSIREIKPYIREDSAAEEIKERARWRGNLHVIGGDGRPESAEYYAPEDIGIFLEIMREHFDLIICDSGAEVGHGLSLGSLISADGVYILLRQSEICMSRAEWLLPLYAELRLNICGHIVCMYEMNSPYSLASTASRLGIKSGIMTIHRSRLGRRAETEGRSLLSVAERRYRRDISALAEEIMNSQGIRKEVGGWLRRDTASQRF